VSQAPSDPPFLDLPDLANERVGGSAILCSDDFFAGMDALVKAKPAVWDEDAYTDRGKWMDGWESRRKRVAGHDWCIVRLGVPGVIKGVVVDTAFFRGNFPESCSIEGAAVDGYPMAGEIAAGARWIEVLPRTTLKGDAKNTFRVESPYRFTHLRLNIFPDGGVARLRVHGEAAPDWRLVGGLDGEIDLASVEVGGVVVDCSDMFFGSRHNLIFPGRGAGMHDGWETKRSRREGYDWAVVKLGARAAPTRVVVDTAHFKGNAPESFALDGADAYDGAATVWREVFPRTKLLAHTRHTFADLAAVDGVTHVRLRNYPDGGISRFALFGRLSEAGKVEQRVRRLDVATPPEAQALLQACCGAKAWAREMSASRPFVDERGLDLATEKAFSKLTKDDWLEAFKAHPRIGDKKPPTTGTAAAWSGQEQKRVDDASDAVKQELAAKNEEYFAKHGFIFIVKATGKTADEMLALLRERLPRSTDDEIKTAAEEQKKITALRLRKL
jgi:allantoicase